MSDTPLHRKLVKLGFQLTHGRETRHHYALWPHGALNHAPDGSGTLMWRGKPAATLLAGGLPAGLQEITLIGSGPSLRDQAPERLPPRSAILLNGAISLSGRVPPLAIAIEDERFIWRHWTMLRDHTPDCYWMLAPAVMRAILQRDALILQDRRILLIEDITKPTGRKRRSLDDPEIRDFVRRGGDGSGLSQAPWRGVVPAGTIAFSAMQFALAARPAQIGLAGIDLSNADAPRFNETAGNTAPSGIVSALTRILAAFTLAKDEATRHNIRLACYSQHSALCGIGYPFQPRL